MPDSLHRPGISQRCSAAPSARRSPSRCVSLLSFLRPKPKKSRVAQELLAAVQDTNRGVNTGGKARQEILDLADLLQKENEGVATTTSDISATWRVLWTTEKETLFILKNAGLFRTEAGEVYQAIDLANSNLQNTILFPPSGQFLIESSLRRAGDQRLEFEFSSAGLVVGGRRLPLPPVGKGWFDTVYLDDELRVAKDSRGDTLVTERDGPPRNL